MRTDLKNVVVLNRFSSSSSETNGHAKWNRFISHLNSVHSAGFSGGCFNEYYGIVNDRGYVNADIPMDVEVISLDEAIDIINFINYEKSNKTFFVRRNVFRDASHWERFIALLNDFGEQVHLSGDQENGYYGVKQGITACVGDIGFNNSNVIAIPLDEGITLIENLTKNKQIMESTMVTAYNGDEIKLSDAVTLCESSTQESQYAIASEAIYSRVHGGYILRDEASQDARGNWFVTDLADEEDYVYSDYNDEWINTNWNDVVYGYTSRGHEEYFMSDDYVYAGGSYFVNADVANECGYHYDENEDEWYHEDEDRPARVSRCNSGYHSGRGRGWKAGDNPKFTVGFEIEKEDDEAGLIHWSAVYSRTGWIKENDGSLDDNGYELVSPIFDLYTDAVDKEIAEDYDLQSLIDADFSDNCGGHINLGSKIYSPAQLFEGLSAFMPLLYSMYTSRLSRNYCQAKLKHQYRSSSDKYASVYIKDNVVEFRIFPAVRSVKNLLWRRDLIRLMCDNINKSELDVLKMLVNQNSKLYKHMRKIYSQEELLEKTKQFIYYSERFNDKKLPPIDPKKFKKGDDNITDSTEDLGA